MLKKLLMWVLSIPAIALAQHGVLVDVRPLSPQELPGGTHIVPAPNSNIAVAQAPTVQSFLCIYRTDDGNTQAVQRIIYCPKTIELKD